MRTDIFGAIITKLATDATLLGYLGGAYVFRARMTAPKQIPSITVMENNDRSDPRVGYNAVKKRDSNPTIQIDVWVADADVSFPCTGEDADLIVERIDALLLDSTAPTAGTRAGTWTKTTSTQQHESDTGIWHNAVRYSFLYVTTDA